MKKKNPRKERKCDIYEVCINEKSDKLEGESEQVEASKRTKTGLHHVIIAQGHNNMSMLQP